MAKLKSCIKVLAARNLHGCNSPSFPKDSPTFSWKVLLITTTVIVTTTITTNTIITTTVIVIATVIIMIFAGCAG